MNKPSLLLRRFFGYVIFLGGSISVSGQNFSTALSFPVIIYILLGYSIACCINAHFVSSSWQGGLDKKLVDLKIIRNDIRNVGLPLPFRDAFIRELISGAPFLFLLFSIPISLVLILISYIICPLATKGQKCLHDIMCRTIVVDKEDKMIRTDKGLEE